MLVRNVRLVKKESGFLYNRQGRNVHVVSENDHTEN